eukprot:406954-Pyramimonas_sp.AAC.1
MNHNRPLYTPHVIATDEAKSNERELHKPRINHDMHELSMGKTHYVSQITADPGQTPPPRSEQHRVQHVEPKTPV